MISMQADYAVVTNSFKEKKCLQRVASFSMKAIRPVSVFRSSPKRFVLKSTGFCTGSLASNICSLFVRNSDWQAVAC